MNLFVIGTKVGSTISTRTESIKKKLILNIEYFYRKTHWINSFSGEVQQKNFVVVLCWTLVLIVILQKGQAITIGHFCIFWWTKIDVVTMKEQKMCTWNLRLEILTWCRFNNDCWRWNSSSRWRYIWHSNESWTWHVVVYFLIIHILF